MESAQYIYIGHRFSFPLRLVLHADFFVDIFEVQGSLSIVACKTTGLKIQLLTICKISQQKGKELFENETKIWFNNFVNRIKIESLLIHIFPLIHIIIYLISFVASWPSECSQGPVRIVRGDYPSDTSCYIYTIGSLYSEYSCMQVWLYQLGQLSDELFLFRYCTVLKAK